jgi:hypothetical protein
MDKPSDQAIVDRPDPRLIANDEDFALALRTLRTQAGLSVRDAAALLAREATDPVPASTLGGWFSGRNLPTLRLVRAGTVATLLAVCGETDPARVGQWLAALERVRRMPGPRPGRDPAPFRGLAQYEPEHAPYFCGRDELVRDLVALTARVSFPIVVVGASGSGKSSLVRAGLIPALGRDHPAVLFTPGSEPLRQLGAALAPGLETSAETVRDRLLADPGAAPGIIRAAALGVRGRPLIVVDQFEEVFASGCDPSECARFVEALVAAGKSSAIVVLCLRADFYPAALAMPALVPVLQGAQLVVGPMDAAQLRRAITEPARVANLTFEPGLVELLLHELAPTDRYGAAHDPGALPLLSHALLSTWEASRARTLTVEHYRATGGIRGAVAKTADDAYRGLPTPEHRELARRMFVRLVRNEDDRTRMRRRVALVELLDGEQPAAWDVLDRFVAARLVTADADAVEIAHEVLVWAWPQLRAWLEADASWREQHRRITLATSVWHHTGRDDGGLLRGTQLAVVAEWLAKGRGAELDPVERDYVDASLRQAGQEVVAPRAARRGRLALLAGGFLLGGLG